MEQDAAKGAEEDRFLATPQTVLPARARAALHALGQRVGLDYFGLDCGVMPDGRLLVFEVETGMIVHDRRSGEPGGPDPAGRIRLAVEAMIDRRSPLRQEAAARGR